MKNFQGLEEKVQKMMDGERKRRDIALKFVQSLQELLLPVAPDLWGEGDDRPEDTATYVLFPKLYFRYKVWYGKDNLEGIGFYQANPKYPEFQVWGKKIEELKGYQFWNMIRDIIEWIPVLSQQMEKKEETREKILDLLKEEI